jgi:trigger factor
MSGKGTIEDNESEVIWHEDEAELVMDKDKTFPKVPFVENVLGMTSGEEKEFQFSFPDDYDDEELAGKEAVFEVKVEQVQNRELPELNDDLAKEEGDYESLEELRQDLEQELFEQGTQQARSDLLEEMIDDLIGDAEIEFPPAAVESELDDMIANLKEQVTRSGWKWEDYLQLQKETEESQREAWRETATERVRRNLVLGQFVREENLTVEQTEIDAELEERLERFDDNEELKEQLRNVYSQGLGLDMITNEILIEKVTDRIEEIVSGNAPDLEEIDAASLSSEEEE